MPLFVTLWSLSGGCIEYNEKSPDPPIQYVGEPGPLPENDWIINTWEQPTSPLDLLFVVDNSGSMLDDQANLAANMPRLLAPVAAYNLDYHIGVVTTDCTTTPCGEFVYAITRDQIGPDNIVFAVQNAVTDLGLGSGTEQGRLALYYALLRDHESATPFLRSSAPLHIVIISDEMDSSNNLADGTLWSALDLEQRVRSNFSVNAIVRQADQLNVVCGAFYAPQYIAMADRYLGENVEICEPDWSAAVDRISAAFTPPPALYYLSNPPIVDTIEFHVVREDGLDIVMDPSSWEYLPAENALRPVAFETPDTLVWALYQAAW